MPEEVITAMATAAMAAIEVVIMADIVAGVAGDSTGTTVACYMAAIPMPSTATRFMTAMPTSTETTGDTLLTVGATAAREVLPSRGGEARPEVSPSRGVEVQPAALPVRAPARSADIATAATRAASSLAEDRALGEAVSEAAVTSVAAGDTAVGAAGANHHHLNT